MSSTRWMANLLLDERRTNLDIPMWDAFRERRTPPTIHEHPVYSRLNRDHEFLTFKLQASTVIDFLPSIKLTFPCMASGLSHIVFNDEFTIDDIDKEGRKFDRGETTSPHVPRDRHHILTGYRTFPS